MKQTALGTKGSSEFKSPVSRSKSRHQLAPALLDPISRCRHTPRRLMTKGRNESKGINKTLNLLGVEVLFACKGAKPGWRRRVRLEGEKRREEKQFPLSPSLSSATILRFYTPNSSHDSKDDSAQRHRSVREGGGRLERKIHFGFRVEHRKVESFRMTVNFRFVNCAIRIIRCSFHPSAQFQSLAFFLNFDCGRA